MREKGGGRRIDKVGREGRRKRRKWNEKRGRNPEWCRGGGMREREETKVWRGGTVGETLEKRESGVPGPPALEGPNVDVVET